MAAIEFETTVTPASTKKEATWNGQIPAGTAIKTEIGNDDLAAVVPAGKVWDVVMSMRVTESNA